MNTCEECTVPDVRGHLRVHDPDKVMGLPERGAEAQRGLAHGAIGRYCAVCEELRDSGKHVVRCLKCGTEW